MLAKPVFQTNPSTSEHTDSTWLRFSQYELPGLIGQIGSKHFISAIMGAISRSVTPVDVCSLFHYDNASNPSNFGTASRVSNEITRLTAERYASGLGLHDPMRLEINNVLASNSIGVFHLFKERISYAPYRELCFNLTGTLERLSILFKDDRSCYAMSFYRTYHSGLFFRNEVNALSSLSEILSSLVLKHLNVSNLSPAIFNQSVSDDILRKLHDRANNLSAREAEVCKLIMLGHSSESISLKLDLSINTILTYRKRAYTKLNINSQNELFHICLH